MKRAENYSGGLMRHREQRALRTHIKGLSLIELMIAMGLGLFLLAGIISLVVSMSQTRVELNKTSEQIENGRYALQLFGDDIHSAGFYGVPQPTAEVYTTPSPCATSATLANLQLGFVAPDTTKLSLPVPVYGYKAGSSLPTCLSNVKTGSEVLVVRYVGTTAVSASSLPTLGTAPYIQVSANSTIIPSEAALAVGKVELDFTLHTKDATLTIAPVRPYTVRAYYLSACDDCSGGGDGIPTLKMAELVGGSIQITPLVEGIEDMHFEYGIDLGGAGTGSVTKDGAPDCYITDPEASTAPTDCSVGTWATTAPYNWPNVTALKVHLLARSVDPTGSWTDTRTYDLGRASRSGPFNDHYKRQVYTSTISVNTVRGARE